MAPEGVDTQPIRIDVEQPHGITPRDHAPLLEELQGNILRGHGRNHVALISWSVLRGRESEMKGLLRALVEKEKIIRSALEQEAEHEERVKARRAEPEKKHPLGLFANIFLSRSGYEVLGILPIPGDPQFHRGMKGSGVKLKDIHCTRWDPFYGQQVHGMILLAHDDQKGLEAEQLRIEKMLEGIADVEIELGEVKKNGHGEVIEHFQFADAHSQPIFLESDFDREARRAAVIGKGRATGTAYDPRATPDLVLARDPGNTEVNAYGSYLVYRKLMQDVAMFEQRKKELARTLEPDDPERIGALVVGRFPDGKPALEVHDDSKPRGGALDGRLANSTPIASRESSAKRRTRLNNFNYKNDPDGKLIPLHSHIRKMNSRSMSYKERQQRIVRRGITYDYSRKAPQRNFPRPGSPDSRVGLLFMCFQADLGRQFEHLQMAANDTEKGLDPIIGQVGEGKTAPPQRWPRSSKSDPDAAPRFYDFHGCVTLKGGEYFFAPSLGFFRKLEPMNRLRLPWCSREVFPVAKHGEVIPTMGDRHGDPSLASNSSASAASAEQDPGAGGGS